MPVLNVANPFKRKTIKPLLKDENKYKNKKHNNKNETIIGKECVRKDSGMQTLILIRNIVKYVTCGRIKAISKSTI
jgi:hypothetical protein